jgi:hypothetical protein
MSAFVIRDALVGHPRITDTDTVQKLPLGTRVTAIDAAYGEGEFVYALGVAGTVVGHAVVFNQDNYQTSLLVPNDIGDVGFAMSANVAAQYGWYQVAGKAVGKVAAAFADNGNCYSTATPGVIDDAIVAGDRIKRCKGASAIDTPSTGLAELEIWHPFVDDAVAA